MVWVEHFEINFPTAGPDDIGLIWNDPSADVSYIWDGVKWDVYRDVDDDNNYWARDKENFNLTPRNPNDTIEAIGYKFDMLQNLETAPKRGI